MGSKMWSWFLWLDSERLQVLSVSETLPSLFSFLTKQNDAPLSPLPNPNHLATSLESKRECYSRRKLSVRIPIHLDGSCPAVKGAMLIGPQNFLSQPPEPCDYRKLRTYGVCTSSTKAITFNILAKLLHKYKIDSWNKQHKFLTYDSHVWKDF